MLVRFSIVTLLAFALATPALAAFNEVNLDSYVNANVLINANTLPIGLSSGNAGTGIPFLVSASPNSASDSGIWLSSGVPGDNLTVSGLSISGQESFYALLNNFYGTLGADEYDITITTAANQTITYKSIGGVDTRDYNANVFTNTIAATTTEWFNNGIGQRYDVRVFSLPVAFANDTITSFKITQVTEGDNAIFAGLTFSSEAGSLGGVPEPGAWALMITGFAGIGAALRRRRSPGVASSSTI
jgi:hypothetical protein